MTAITRAFKGFTTILPAGAQRVGSGLICGANISGGMPCYIEGLVGTAKPSIYSMNAAPVAPTVAGNGSGSSYGAGTYAVQTTYKTPFGETTPSPAVLVTLTAAQNIRVSAQGGGVLPAGVTFGAFYVNGVRAVADVASSGGSIPQTDLTGATPAVAGGPPAVNTAGLGTVAAGTGNQYRVHGFSMTDCLVAQNDAVTLFNRIDVRYSAGFTQAIGAPVYLSATAAGGLDDAPPYPGVPPLGHIIDSTRAALYASQY